MYVGNWLLIVFVVFTPSVSGFLWFRNSLFLSREVSTSYEIVWKLQECTGMIAAPSVNWSMMKPGLDHLFWSSYSQCFSKEDFTLAVLFTIGIRRPSRPWKSFYQDLQSTIFLQLYFEYGMIISRWDSTCRSMIFGCNLSHTCKVLGTSKLVRNTF